MCQLENEARKVDDYGVKVDAETIHDKGKIQVQRLKARFARNTVRAGEKLSNKRTQRNTTTLLVVQLTPCPSSSAPGTSTHPTCASAANATLRYLV